MPWWGEQNDVVISGISGRFPESENIAEFSEHLLNGDDLVTEDNRRWEPGFYELPKRHAKLKSLNKFDASYFGVPPKQAYFMDPQIRLLLEVASEAILDAGMNPHSMRGSNTGVFVGASASETGAMMTGDLENISGYSLTGCVRSMFANRLSFAFDLQGPSFTVDTACSSSLLALQLALDAIRTGQCDAALVAGSHLTLSPTTSIQFQKLNMLTPEGACKSFDASGNGYARSEGVGCILLQKANVAKRLYATVVHAKSSTDGYKQHGITFPSAKRQTELLETVYREAGIDPSSVAYVECHGTGTVVGDPQEAQAVTDVFCKNRSDPLLIGSVKSNMGHCEPASGMASIAKVLIAMETGLIPPNLHFNKPNPHIPSLQDGRLKVVTEPTPWNGGLVGVNSFGFGGSNTHVLLRSNSIPNQTIKQTTNDLYSLPRLLCVPGRTQEAVDSMIEAIHQNRDDTDFLRLLMDTAHIPLTQFPFRGYTIVHAKPGDPIRHVERPVAHDVTPVYFIYTGMGSQWAGMAQDMMAVDSFRKSILKCSEVVIPLGLDPYAIIMKGSQEEMADTLHSMVCITTIQLAFTDLLRDLGIIPDGIIGHSTGETACAYADGSMSREEAMLCIYHRGKAVSNANLPRGAMAAIGLSWKETGERIPKGIIRACHNGKDSVTISGEAEQVEKMTEELEAEGIFAKLVNCGGVAFHSHLMEAVREDMLSRFRKVLPSPKSRSPRWISTSVPENDWDGQLASFCSPEYQVNNALSPVLFYEALQKIPPHATTIEIAPHCLMQAILRRNLPNSVTNVGLMNIKQENNLEFFLRALGKVYQSGVSVHVENLYPRLPSYPVRQGTLMISPLIKWDHSQDFHVVSMKDWHAGGGGVPASATYLVDPLAPDSKEQYLMDHVIDGRALFPFTGHVVLAWKAICKFNQLDYKNTSVVFEDVTVLRPTILSKPVKFDVIVTPTGRFEIMEGDSLAACGNVEINENPEAPSMYASCAEPVSSDQIQNTETGIHLNAQDVYKELLLRGYEYGQNFRGIYKIASSIQHAQLCWNGNWVTFLDSLLQTALFAERADTLKLPIRLRYLRIDPQRHLKAMKDKNGLQIVELATDAETGGCVAGGVEVSDLTASTIQRRFYSSSRAYIGKYMFIKNKDNSCFENYPALRAELQNYSAICRNIVGSGVKKWTLGSTSYSSDNYLCNLLRTISANLGETLIKGGEVESKYFDNKDKTLVNLLNDIFSIEMNGTNASAFVHNIKSIVRDKLISLESDTYWMASWSIRSAKPLIDIIGENIPGHTIPVIMIEPGGPTIPIFIRDIIHTRPLIVSDITLVGSSLENLDAARIEKEGFDTLNMSVDDDSDSLPASKKGTPFLCCSRILSRKSNIPKFLENVKSFLRDDGFLLVEEVTQDFELAAFVDALSSDSDQIISTDPGRKYGQFLSHGDWMQIFPENGFRVVGFQRDPSSPTTLYLLHKIPSIPRDPCFVAVDDVKEFSWISPLQEVIDERLKEPENRTIWLIDTENKFNGLNGLSLCLREESALANRFRMIHDSSKCDGTPQISLEDPEVKEIIANDIHKNIYQDGEWGSYALIPVDKGEMFESAETEHAFVNTLVRGDLTSLRWVESSNQFFYHNPHHLPSHKLCAVYYTALNFRDIMLATGRLPPDAIPGQFADKECLLGMEYSGRLMEGGTRVMGILPAQALATTLVCDSNYSWQVPDNWTMKEAATVPVIYCTAYYALFVRGKMRKGDRVLIHSGSGGVGQAAIAIALHHGCEVFTTVSNLTKKEFLKTKFPQLQECHFSNSRTTEFEVHIKKQTKGKGVDIVLNSLSEDKLHASLRCLGENGRFLEIGKFDLANNSKIGLGVFLKNVTFHGILLDSLVNDPSSAEWIEVGLLLRKGIQEGAVTPINLTIFDRDSVEAAFRLMAQGKHIGKVLIEVREDDGLSKISLPPVVKVNAIKRSVCHPQHVYLITGGLGGFGLELAQWLINRGARKLVLTSRNGIKSGYQARSVNFWKNSGIEVLISKTNIAEEIDAETLVRECQEMGPLGGVFHLAMILKDCLFENQTADNFKDAAASKYFGTINLDKATRKLCGSELRWFVGFSSITAGMGNTGQTNYGWANSAMERVIEKRHADGKGGLTILWGAIGDVGVIIENFGDNSTVVGGTLPQRIPNCLQALDAFLNWETPIVTSYIRAETGGKTGKSKGDIMETIANILGVNDISQLNPNATLSDLGLDSLMGVEIKQAVERDYAIVLSMKEIRTMTLNKLKAMCEGTSDAERSELTPEEIAEIEKETERIEEQMFSLFKLRIDVNDLKTDEDCAHINDVTEGNPIYFVHSIEGIGGPLRTLASKLTVPAYCFQTTPSAPLETIEHLAAYYIQIMKEKSPRGPYRLAGYSYGAAVAFEMAAQLQSAHPDDPHIVDPLILLDGSHAYMRTYRLVYRMAFGVKSENLVNDPTFETEILCGMAMRFMLFDYKDVREDLIKLPNWDARVKKITDVVMPSGFFDDREVIEFGANCMRLRFIAADKYSPNKKFKGTMSLIRAMQSSTKGDDADSDYGLKEVTDGNVNVLIVPGDHDSFVQGESSGIAAQHIMDLLGEVPTEKEAPRKEDGLLLGNNRKFA